MGPTQVVAIGCLLVFIPWDLIVFVQVVITPDLCHILIDVTFLYSLDPGLEFIGGDISIAIAVNAVNDFSEEVKKKQNLLVNCCLI